MQRKEIKLSILIVYYKVKPELFVCLESIIDSKPHVPYEIIVVDNETSSGLRSILMKKFPEVKYIKSHRNSGYGAGNNLGVRYSKGKYIFILNPDTIIFPKTIDVLIKFLENNNKIGIVAPNLYDKNGNIFLKQGLGFLTPAKAVFALSFVNNLFPNNSISKAYWGTEEDKNKIRYVEAVPGTAFVMEKELFEKVGKFDERFFLFFEEFDLCRRVSNLGYKLAMVPQAKVIHLWGQSTKHNPEIDKTFLASRFYYFKKNFGLLDAIFVDIILRMGRHELLLISIIGFSMFVNFYQLSRFTQFFGDVGWFYVSARDMILTHHIPLVGITSSHTWLHQGPLWTYILAVILKLTNFNVLAGAYFTAGLGVLVVYLVYKLAYEMFSQRVGLISAFIYSTSVLIIQNSRMPYHTSIIPFFIVLFLFSIYRWIKGNPKYFPLVLFFLAILYNFELATFSIGATFILIILYGLLRRKKWMLNILTKRILALSIIAFVIPMIPMIFYDIHHGYPQTVRFVVWVFYKIALVFGYPNIHPNAPGETWATFFPYLFQSVKELIYVKSTAISLLVVLLSSTYLLQRIYRDRKEKKVNASNILILLFFLLPTAAYIFEKTNSAAYFLMFFPQTMIMVALFVDYLARKKNLFLPVLALMVLIGLSNVYTLIHNNYYSVNTYQEELNISKKIINRAYGREYNLIGKGNGSQYESFLKPCVYLTWQLGNPPIGRDTKLKFYILQYPDRIKLVEKQ